MQVRLDSPMRLLAAFFVFVFMLPAPMAAQAQTLEQQLQEARQQVEALQSRLDEQNKQVFDAPRLLTIWDRMEKEMTGIQWADFKLEDKSVKTQEDVVRVFTKVFPAAYDIKADPKYVDPLTLIPETDQGNPLYEKYNNFVRWRTKPVAPELTDLEDLSSRREEVLRYVERTPLEKSGINSQQADAIRSAWVRRMRLALDYQWPWALGLAKVDVLSAVHKLGTYREGGVIHVEVGMLNRLPTEAANEPVLRLFLPEVGEISELAYKCVNGYIVELAKTRIAVTVTTATCERVEGEPVRFTSNDQTVCYRPVFSSANIDVRNSRWTLRDQAFNTATTEVSVGGSNVVVDQLNTLVYNGEVREKGNEALAWSPVSCSINLSKVLPPPPPPPPAPVKSEAAPPPPAETPKPRCATCGAKKAKCGGRCIAGIAAGAAGIAAAALLAGGSKGASKTPTAAASSGCSPAAVAAGTCH